MTLVSCKACAGKGSVELPEHLVQMLAILRGGPPLSAPEVYLRTLDREAFGVTAINQRLEDLRGLGLVERERRGKTYFYKARETEP